MDNRFKIVLTGNSLYKEIELAPDAKHLKIGTGIDSDVRLHKNMFFGEIELSFIKNDGEWTLRCSDNIYITVGDIRKLMTKKLENGDSLEIKYYDSNIRVFSIEFVIDFDDGNIRYERIVDTSYQPEIRIGAAATSDIIIKSDYIKQDQITLKKESGNYRLTIANSTYGVLHNGQKAQSGEIVKDGDFISISDFFFCIKDGRVWTQIRDGIRVNSVRYTDKPALNGYPCFNRNTRVKTIVNQDKIDILDPPQPPEKPKNNLLTRLLPSMGMLVASVFMASKGGSMIIFSALSGVMSIVTAVLGLIEGKKEFKQQTAKRIETYNDYIERKKEEIDNSRSEELESLNEIYIPQSEEIEYFDRFSPKLFDRRREDEDFLSVRLGIGSIVSQREINYKKQEKLEIEDELQKLPGEICEEYRYLDDAPIVCNFKDANAIGIVGQEQFRFDMLKNIVIDIAARQYESDIRFIFVAEPEHRDRVYWFRYLPQTFCDVIGNRTIVCNDESKNLIFEYLYKELTTRSQTKKIDSNIVVFFYDEYGFKNHPISKFVDQASTLGVTFVFFDAQATDVPMGCSHIIEITDAQNAELIDVKDKSNPVEFEYDRISEQETQDIIDILAPVYTEELSLEGTLTKNISLFELLNIIAVDDMDIKKRWDSSKVSKSMAAPLGVSKSGVVYLDLHDKAHGPHGLVAGTTGSGKSEILQTYILSMATLYHPYEVGFVIIDFKGGGMVNQFRELPHLVGAITNIDGKEIDRSLKSIKAELQKRQRYFAEAEVNHIDKYITKFKKGEVSEPLPHLIIIVDEFAELKAEQPEFMKELISAARIGRSLGVHLILATQKPSGQVNEQIWSNSRFKLCLKVQDQSDSNEVLKSPLAAEIKEPGRAYLQVGNNEIFELFQSAYSGASEHADEGNVKEFTVFNIADNGKRIPIYSQKKSKSDANSATQLDAVVRYVHDFCENNAIRKLPDICLPPLPSLIKINDSSTGKDADYNIEIGLYDDPDNQYQGSVSMHLATDNTLVIGSSQTGKTNLLQTIIRQIGNTYSPKELAMYIIDFGAMSLCNFENMNHVGGVVTASEEEKIKNLFKLVAEEILVRKQKLSDSGLSSFHAYREAGNTDMPLILIIMDNFSVFKELYSEDYENAFIGFLRDGITYGISIIVSNSQTSGLSYRYLSNIGNRIAFNCNDRGEYTSVLDRCRIEPSNIPGRAVTSIDKNIFEFQTYLSFEGEKEIDRVNAVKSFVKKVNAKYGDMRVKQIPSIPERVSISYIDQNYPMMNMQENVAIGLDYSSIERVTINCFDQFVLAIAGKNVNCRQQFIKTMMTDLQKNYFVRPVKLFIIDNFNREFGAYKDIQFTELYKTGADGIKDAIEIVSDELENRYSQLEEDGIEAMAKMPWMIVVVNNKQAFDALAQSRDHESRYQEISKKYSNLKILFLLTEVNDATIPSSTSQLLRKVRDDKKLLYFGSSKEMKIIELYGSAYKNTGALTSQDDAYWLNGENVLRIKTIQEV